MLVFQIIISILLLLACATCAFFLWRLDKPLPLKPKETVIGFDSQKPVRPNEPIAIASKALHVFQPNRLVLASSCASSFLIDEVTINTKRQNTASGPLPGDAFSPSAFGVRLHYNIAKKGDDIVVQVVNISEKPLRFNAALFGYIIEQN